MFGSGRDGGDESVTCIACGHSLVRSEAREYDKEGDRWDRHGKEFEYLCKDCHSDLCHQPRDELEALLADVESSTGDSPDREEFLREYSAEVEARYGTLGDPESGADPDDRRGR
jgi:formate-dependent nitrite reductase cytochrome c552 subunit